MSEVNEMIKVLELLSEKDESYYISQLNVEGNDNMDKRYIGISTVRNASYSERQKYSIAPEECFMVYRMEKICMAHNFLESLEQIKQIFNEVESAINSLKEMNKSLYPEILDTIPPIEEEISKLKKEHKGYKVRKDRAQTSFDRLENQLHRILNKTDDRFEREDKKEEFIKKHPNYEIFQKEIREYDEIIRKLESKLTDRESLLNRLETYKGLIEKHCLINQN